jgi:hypothetical protein
MDERVPSLMPTCLNRSVQSFRLLIDPDAYCANANCPEVPPPTLRIESNGANFLAVTAATPPTYNPGMISLQTPAAAAAATPVFFRFPFAVRLRLFLADDDDGGGGGGGDDDDDDDDVISSGDVFGGDFLSVSVGCVVEEVEVEVELEVGFRISLGGCRPAR